MAYPPLPPNEGGEPSDATRAAGVRLTDAEQAEADRLDLNGEASLKDALADIVANGTQDEIERLASRIGAARGTFTAPNGDASSLPLLAGPAGQGLPGEPSEGTLLGLRDWSEARATVAAELAEIQSQPQFLQAEPQQGGGTHWHPAQQQDAEPYQPEQEPAQPVQAVTPEPALLVELPPAEPLVAESVAAEPVVAEPPAPEPPVSELPLAEPADAQSPDTTPEAPLAGLTLAELTPAEPPDVKSPETTPEAPPAGGLTLAELTPAEPSLVEPPRPQSLYARLEASRPEPPLPEPSHPEPPRPQSLSARLETPRPEPILPDPARPQSRQEATVASALDAAAKLAADADAAATALENLSRMLQAHQRPASMVPSPGQHAALRPMNPAARSGIPDSRPIPMPPRSVMPDGDPLQMPTPRPEHRPVQRVMRPAPPEIPAARPVAARPVRPPTLRPTPMQRDARYDLRGFMAGFTVAGAIGALLYIYLMTG